MKRNLFGIMLLSGISILPKANAQTTYEEMEQLTVNEQITTVITASEPVRFVDISTDKVAGDQPIDNIIRLKPKESGHEDGEILAIVTIVTERSGSLNVHCRHDTSCTAHLELTCKNPQRSYQSTPHGDASEQYLLGG